MSSLRLLGAAAVLVFGLLGLAPAAAGVGGSEQAGVAQAGSDPGQRAPGLSTTQAIVLGAIEGLTEYVPVSSTGHLTVAQRAMDIGQTPETKGAADSYAIAIQLGAILAVAGLYRRRFVGMVEGVAGRNAEGRQLALSIMVAFVPSALVGLVFQDQIKEHLFGAWPIVAAWLAGGVAILATTSWQRRQRRTGGRSLADLRFNDAALIGLAQCLALWPGVSRSLVTILAALFIGFKLPAAVEFSFLLGFVTLGAATGYETVVNGSTMVEAFGWLNPLVGLLAAFIFACAAITWMVGYLNRHSLALFGYYRLALGGVVGLLLVTNVF